MLTIRPYLASDWARLCDVHDRARMDELRRSVGVAAFRPLVETAEDEGLFDGRLDVAEIDGRVQGFVAYGDDSLDWLYVHPDCHRRGIGRGLLRHAIAQAGPVVGAQVLEGNEPALRLYLSEGFVEIGRRSGRLSDNEAFPATGVLLERRRPLALPTTA